jgi:uncharacterized membrane protein YuzA (DUF378 family)
MSDTEEKKCTTLDKIFGNFKWIDGFDIAFLVVVLIGCLNWAPVVFGYPDVVKRLFPTGWLARVVYGLVVLCAIGKAITYPLVRTQNRDKKVDNEPTE